MSGPRCDKCDEPMTNRHGRNVFYRHPTNYTFKATFEFCEKCWPLVLPYLNKFVLEKNRKIEVEP